MIFAGEVSGWVNSKANKNVVVDGQRRKREIQHG